MFIFAFQLFVGMKNYKRHKLQLFKGIYKEIPSAGILIEYNCYQIQFIILVFLLVI